MSNNPPTFAGSIPENYERYLGPLLFEPYAADLASRVDPAGLGSVLEIACGTGRVTAHLLKRLAPETRLVATDLNPDMITIGKAAVPDPRIEWGQADVQALPFGENSFDLVICQFGLMFVPDKASALAEAYRVLKPGGRLLTNTWDRLENNPAFFLANQYVTKYFPTDPPKFFHIPFSMHDENELLSLLKGAGFSNPRITLVKKEGKSPSAADAVMGMLEGSPIYLTINERDPAILPVLKKDLEAGLSERYGAEPMICPLQAWVMEAEKA